MTPGAGCRLTAPVSLQSLVLLSRLPFVRLFQSLLSLMAPEYFDKLAPCLEAGRWLSSVASVGPVGLSKQLLLGKAPDLGLLCPQFVMRLTSGQPLCLGRP